MEDSESDFSDISDIFSDSEIPQVKCKAEAKVLKSVDKDAHHPDDWPTFPLEDATVHKTDGSLANLLNVELQGPFVIRGRLRVDTEHEEFRAWVVIVAMVLQMEADMSSIVET